MMKFLWQRSRLMGRFSASEILDVVRFDKKDTWKNLYPTSSTQSRDLALRSLPSVKPLSTNAATSRLSSIMSQGYSEEYLILAHATHLHTRKDTPIDSLDQTLAGLSCPHIDLAAFESSRHVDEQPWLFCKFLSSFGKYLARFDSSGLSLALGKETAGPDAFRATYPCEDHQKENDWEFSSPTSVMGNIRHSHIDASSQHNASRWMVMVMVLWLRSTGTQLATYVP
jgi:hypothetical protein